MVNESGTHLQSQNMDSSGILSLSLLDSHHGVLCLGLEAQKPPLERSDILADGLERSLPLQELLLKQHGR